MYPPPHMTWEVSSETMREKEGDRLEAEQGGLGEGRGGGWGRGEEEREGARERGGKDRLEVKRGVREA
jgi:hypothetical protein